MPSSRRRFLKNAAAMGGVALGQNVTPWSSRAHVGTAPAVLTGAEEVSPGQLLAAHEAEHAVVAGGGGS